MKPIRAALGLLYMGSGAGFVNAVWLFTQPGRDQQLGLVFVLVGVFTLAIALACEGLKERSDD